MWGGEWGIPQIPWVKSLTAIRTTYRLKKGGEMTSVASKKASVPSLGGSNPLVSPGKSSGLKNDNKLFFVVNMTVHIPTNPPFQTERFLITQIFRSACQRMKNTEGTS